jgi:hypothetical protein
MSYQARLMEYERVKKILQNKCLSPKEYEKSIRDLARRLKI